jgi:hypothetical protein
MRASFTMPFAFLVLAAACSGNAGSGSASFTTWGEESIEQGIPASAFADGWSVRYERFLVALGGVTLRISRRSEPVAVMPRPRVFDLVKPGVKPVVLFATLPPGPLPFVSYEIAPPTANAELGDGATAADLDELTKRGASVYVEGTATKGATSKRFAWSFPGPTLYDECKGEKDGKLTDGVVIATGGTDDVQLTVHGDHLFYNDLQSPEAVLRFEPIAAADADGDGNVTQDELAAVKLANLAVELGYGTGSAPNVNTLADFVAALARTVGHFRGEGECFSRAVTIASP